MKKLKTLFVLFVILGNVYSQGPIFGFDKGHILYRGYKNRVEFGTSDGRPFEILVEGGEMSADTMVHSDEELINSIIVNYLSPSNYDKTKVIFLDPTSKVPFDTIEFKNYPLPDPSLYWGAAKEGEKGSRNETRLFARYPPEIPLNATFRILAWECLLSVDPGGPLTVIEGKGDEISPAASLLMRSIKTGMNVIFICTVVGPDGILRKEVGTFKL